MVPEDKIIDFDECPITLNSCNLIIGMTDSGKTVLLRAIINRLKEEFSDEIQEIWVYSRTAYINREQYDFTNNIRKIDTQHAKKHLIKQEILKLASEKDERIKQKYKNIIVIFDDFISEIPSSSSIEARVLNDFASMGRHFNITTIILTQHYAKLSTTVRSNSKYIYCTVVDQESLLNLFSLQRDYTSKRLFWEDYNQFTTENNYSFMLMQRKFPRQPNVMFVKACPLVHFIDLNDLESDNSNCDDTSDN